MKDLFPGHYKIAANDRLHLWKYAAIVFDANVLLNLYRYSDATKNELLAVIEHFGNRVWIPFQAAKEFHENRLKVIEDQIKKYEDAQKQVESLLASLQSKRAHPFVDSSTLNRVEKTLEELSTSLRDGLKLQDELLNDDPIIERIAMLLAGKVGEEPDAEVILKIVENANDRIKRKIPPGYCDSGRKDDATGDALIWLEIIEFAKQARKGVLFVTDDQKDDWWISARGRTLGPRPELLKEFNKETSQRIYIYQPGPFLNLAAKDRGKSVTDSVLEEVEALSTRRRLRTRGPHRGEWPFKIVGICSHIEKHITEIEEYVNHVNSISHEEWKTAGHPMTLSSELFFSLERCIKKCPCIVVLAKFLWDAPLRTVLNSIEGLKDDLAPEAASLALALRRMHPRAMEYTLWLDEFGKQRPRERSEEELEDS